MFMTPIQQATQKQTGILLAPFGVRMNLTRKAHYLYLSGYRTAA
jgi:hypothetical protein